MFREIRTTADGSHTIFVPGLNENYHSIHGAIRESLHVFIMQGLHTVKKPFVRILETGFGTGLNALLTLKEVTGTGRSAYYHAVEKYPLEPHEFESLNHADSLGNPFMDLFDRMHRAGWGFSAVINEHFTLFKEKSDFREMNPDGLFDLVYYDAFDPKKQPGLWSESLFSRIAEYMVPGGVLVTYSAKGSVRRALINNGFQVEKVPGPPGKKEMIRAVRN